jgi:hypothetical protein
MTNDKILVHPVAQGPNSAVVTPLHDSVVRPDEPMTVVHTDCIGIGAVLVLGAVEPLQEVQALAIQNPNRRGPIPWLTLTTPGKKANETSTITLDATTIKGFTPFGQTHAEYWRDRSRNEMAEREQRAKRGIFA